MAGQIDINARLNEVKARVEGLRPNLLPQLKTMVQERRSGGLMQRIRGIAMARPMLGQVMTGKFATGGEPSAASAQIEIQQSGFRGVPETPVTTAAPLSGFRSIT